MAYKNREDQQACWRRHYERNKEQYVQRAKERNLALRKLVRDLKDIPCTDCKQSFPTYCMDFDHVRGKKKFTIASNTQRIGKKKLLAEIAKCEVVCANCHRIRTYNRDG